MVGASASQTFSPSKCADLAFHYADYVGNDERSFHTRCPLAGHDSPAANRKLASKLFDAIIVGATAVLATREGLSVERIGTAKKGILKSEASLYAHIRFHKNATEKLAFMKVHDDAMSLQQLTM